MNSSDLSKSAQGVASSVRQLERVWPVLAGEVVDHVLNRFAREHGLSYATLLQRFKEPVVLKHVGGRSQQLTTKLEVLCKGTTAQGFACSNPGKHDGWCYQHAKKRAPARAPSMAVLAAPLAAPARELRRVDETGRYAAECFAAYRRSSDSDSGDSGDSGDAPAAVTGPSP